MRRLGCLLGALGFASALGAAAPAAVSPAARAAVPAPVSAAAKPTPAVPLGSPPGAPSDLRAEFRFITFASKAAVPSVRLTWKPARQTDFLLKHYKLEALSGVSGSAQSVEVPASQTWFVDQPVALGVPRRYRVSAVDTQGLSSPATPPANAPLDALPLEVLAPLAPQGLTATSRRVDVHLRWQPSQAMADPISYYRVFRAENAGSLWQSKPRRVDGNEYVDSDLELAKDYVFGIQVVDEKGRVSPRSVTVSARATGTLPPSAPRELTATGGVERVLLQWEAALPGTAKVSRYHIVRINPSEEDEEERSKVLEPKKPLDLKYSDGKVDGGVSYLYEVYALDVEGNTSPAAKIEALPLLKPYDWSSIFLMPTAFSNNPSKNLRGFNLNVLFDFYVGSIYETFKDPVLNREKGGVFQRIQVGTFTGDFKYSLLGDQRWLPGIAAGLYTVSLLSLGQPGSSGSTTVAATSTAGDNAFQTFGGVYLSASKRLWGKAALHGGYLRGNLGRDLSGVAPESWHTTIQHLTPHANVPDLMDRLIDPSLGVPVDTPPDLMFAALKLPFTIPVFKKRTALQLEWMTPIPDERGTEKLPWMLTLGLEDVQTFGFEFSYVQFFGGYEILAFYHFRDLSWSW